MSAQPGITMKPSMAEFPTAPWPGIHGSASGLVAVTARIGSMSRFGGVNLVSTKTTHQLMLFLAHHGRLHRAPTFRK
jgi:hypothetical protein